jgi:hypothetical protein
MTDGPLIDLAVFGRHLRAARILAGYDNVAPAAAHITECTGVHVTERILGAIERGDQMPTLEQFLAIGYCLRPPGGGAFWAPALRPDIAAGWVEELDEQEVRRHGKPAAPPGPL